MQVYIEEVVEEEEEEGEEEGRRNKFQSARCDFAQTLLNTMIKLMFMPCLVIAVDLEK